MKGHLEADEAEGEDVALFLVELGFEDSAAELCEEFRSEVAALLEAAQELVVLIDIWKQGFDLICVQEGVRTEVAVVLVFILEFEQRVDGLLEEKGPGNLGERVRELVDGVDFEDVAAEIGLLGFLDFKELKKALDLREVLVDVEPA